MRINCRLAYQDKERVGNYGNFKRDLPKYWTLFMENSVGRDIFAESKKTRGRWLPKSRLSRCYIKRFIVHCGNKRWKTPC